MNTSKENVIVVRDKDNKIVAVISKTGTCTEIYSTEIVGFDEISDLLTSLTK